MSSTKQEVMTSRVSGEIRPRPGFRLGWNQLPNTICVARVLIIFTGLYFLGQQYAADHTWNLVWVAAISVAALTDRLDGFLAKRYHWTSALGAFLDQTSDKLVTLAFFAFLTIHGAFAVWALAAVILRELFVTGLRIAANRLGIAIGTGEAGRFKTFVQHVAAGAIFLHWAYPQDALLGFTALQWVVWGGWAIFAVVVLILGRRALRGFYRIYTVTRVDRNGVEHRSLVDLVLVVVTLLCIPLPADYASLICVLLITVGTGVTYFQGFLWEVRQRRPPHRIWPGPILVLVASALTTAGMGLLLERLPTLAMMWIVIGACCVLWIVLLAAAALTEGRPMPGPAGQD